MSTVCPKTQIIKKFPFLNGIFPIHSIFNWMVYMNIVNLNKQLMHSIFRWISCSSKPLLWILLLQCNKLSNQACFWFNIIYIIWRLNPCQWWQLCRIWNRYRNTTPLRCPLSFQKHYHLIHILTTQMNGRRHKTKIR